MSLGDYQKKRDFKRTPEPSGKKLSKKSSGNTFVVQKHDASHLHYDFRLELDGTLKSWAIPKGPSCNPKDKQIAVHVEDHPVEYGSFEGTIPSGQYGAGTVLVWDRGTWESEGANPLGAYKAGRLKFTLQGAKLRGGWTLVRMKGKEGESKENWLLIKEKDEFADVSHSITEEKPDSVVTGRSLGEVSGEIGDSVKKVTVKKKKPTPVTGRRAKSTKVLDPSALADAIKAKQPPFIIPQLCTLVKSPPVSEQWLHEVKYDGYRIEAVKGEEELDLYTRNKQRWTAKFPEIVAALAKFQHQFVLDGEVVVLRPDGTSDFQALQNVLNEKKHNGLSYMLFDLLHLDGYDLTAVPLQERKTLLAQMLQESPHHSLRYADHIHGEGSAVFENACHLHLEGIISKRVDSPYVQKRSRYWVKAKCLKSQEFVIGGYTDPGGSRIEFGALLLGHYAKGKLVYAGKVGTGFMHSTLRAVGKELKKHTRKSSPFNDPLKGSEFSDVHWVEPEMVCEVEFTEWTADGHLRHPAFKGLREDKPATSITREDPESTPSAVAKPKRKKATKNGRKAGIMEIAGVTITHPEKLLYPEGITKSDLCEYYQRVSPHLLPYLSNRPLSLVRCPQGRDKQCFFQKHPGESIPPHVRTTRIKESKGEADYIVIDNVEGLLELANLGVLEFHVWGCRADKVEKPDTMVFDLDPSPGVSSTALAAAALALRTRLEDLGLDCYLKATGGKGLHVVVPIVRRHTWDEVKEFSRSVATELAHAQPERYVATMSKAKRKGRIFIDYFRNSRGATFIAPFSTRARANAPVSIPLSWAELDDSIDPAAWTLENIENRLRIKKNPWKGYSEAKQSLTKEMKSKLSTPSRN